MVLCFLRRVGLSTLAPPRRRHPCSILAFAHIDMDAVPAPTDKQMHATIMAATEALGLSYKLMPSGAGHDAQDMARIAPTGMIFVPSVDGISHSPREFTHPPGHGQWRGCAVAHRAQDLCRDVR